MAYDFEFAKKTNADIITMPTNLIKKLDKFGYSAKKYSVDTVKTFFDDAKKCFLRILRQVVNDFLSPKLIGQKFVDHLS